MKFQPKKRIRYYYLFVLLFIGMSCTKEMKDNDYIVPCPGNINGTNITQIVSWSEVITRLPQIQQGLSDEEVISILGSPTYCRDLFSPYPKHAKPIGVTLWYIRPDQAEIKSCPNTIRISLEQNIVSRVDKW